MFFHPKQIIYNFLCFKGYPGSSGKPGINGAKGQPVSITSINSADLVKGFHSSVDQTEAHALEIRD